MAVRQIQVYRVVTDLAGNVRTDARFYVVQRGGDSTQQIPIALTPGGTIQAQPVSTPNGVISFYADPAEADLLVQGTGFADLPPVQIPELVPPIVLPDVYPISDIALA